VIDPAAPLSQRLRNFVKKGSKKVTNLIGYVVRTRFAKAKNSAKIRLFRYCRDHGLSVPAVLKGIPVRLILRFAEKEYVTPAPYDGEVVLFRATQKDTGFLNES